MLIKSSPAKNNICAVVVSHDPGEDFILNIRSIVPQVGKVVVVNNGSKKFKSAFLEKAGFEDKIYLINNSENLGQGNALNQGVRWALSQDFKWVLLSDQDSLLGPSMVQELVKAYQSYSQREKVGMIGSNCTYRSIKEVKYKKECRDKMYFERDVVMMSGSLLSVLAYNQAGPFREEFFIDAIDMDYCLKLRAKGFRLIVACRAQMFHNVGKMTGQRFFGRKGFVTNHSPERCYYMIRNMVVLLKEYVFREPYWVLRNIVWLFFVKPSCVILYEKDKAKKIKEMIRGFFHGLIGKLGKYQ